MSGRALLDALRSLGARLTVDADGRLRCRVARGVLTDELRADLADHKEALVGALRVSADETGGAASPYPIYLASELLGEHIAIACESWLADEDPPPAPPEGEPAFYSLEELEALTRVSPDMARAAHRVKRVLGGRADTPAAWEDSRGAAVSGRAMRLGAPEGGEVDEEGI